MKKVGFNALKIKAEIQKKESIDLKNEVDSFKK